MGHVDASAIERGNSGKTSAVAAATSAKHTMTGKTLIDDLEDQHLILSGGTVVAFCNCFPGVLPQ